MTEFIRCLIAAELRRAGVDTAPLVARLGEGQGRRSDFDDERRSRALAQLADARKARRAKTREMRIGKLAALVLAELAARENDAASADETASGAA